MPSLYPSVTEWSLRGSRGGSPALRHGRPLGFGDGGSDLKGECSVPDAGNTGERIIVDRTGCAIMELTRLGGHGVMKRLLFRSLWGFDARGALGCAAACQSTLSGQPGERDLHLEALGAPAVIDTG